MDFRGSTSGSGGGTGSGRLSSGSHLNGVPILPVSNERNSGGLSASRPGNLGMSNNNSNNGSGISMPLSLPVPTLGQPQKRQRLDTPVAPPPGMSFPYRLNVDLSTYPPAAHATSIPPQQSPHQQRHPANDLSFFAGANSGLGTGLQNDSFGSTGSTGFEFPSTRRTLGYPTPQSASFPSTGGMNGMFGARPGPQTTNMLLDLLNSTSGNDVSTFEWPGSPHGGQLDGTFPSAQAVMSSRTHVPC